MQPEPSETQSPVEQVEEIRMALSTEVEKLRQVVAKYLPDTAPYYDRYLFGALDEIVDGDADQKPLSANIADILDALDSKDQQ